MAEMNQTQVKYARQRAQEIFNEKKSRLKKDFSKPGKTLSLKDKLKALQLGEFEIVEPVVNQTVAMRNGISISYYDDYRYNNRSGLESCIQFKAETKPTFDAAGHTAAEKALTEAYRALTDELMLGDNQEALKLLKAFEAA